jgi:TonB family protein
MTALFAGPARALTLDEIVAIPFCSASGIIPPTIATVPADRFPFVGLKFDSESTTVIQALVGVDGHVSWALRERSSGSDELDLAADDRVREETFHPATRNSEPITCRLVVPVKWTPQPQKRDDLPPCDTSDVVPPTIAYSPPVKYPPLAMRLNHEGLVVINAVVGTDGHTSGEVVTTPTGFLELDQVALDRTAQEVFHPATMSGKPIACHLTVRVNWNLTSGPPNAQK